MHNRWFYFGVFMFLVAIGFAVWGFSLGVLTPDQRRLATFSTAIASGFACGAFSGEMNIKLQGFIPRLIVIATGGFAVWIITFFFLFPASQPVSDAELKLKERTSSVASLHSYVEEANKSMPGATFDELVDRVRTDAPVHAEVLASLPNTHLRKPNQMVKYEYLALAWVCAGYFEDDPNTQATMARQAISASDSALTLIDEFKMNKDAGNSAAIELWQWIVRDRTEGRVIYFKAVAAAMLAKAGAPDFPIHRCLELIERIPDDLLALDPVAEDTYLAWVVEMGDSTPGSDPYESQALTPRVAAMMTAPEINPAPLPPIPPGGGTDPPTTAVHSFESERIPNMGEGIPAPGQPDPPVGGDP